MDKVAMFVWFSLMSTQKLCVYQHIRKIARKKTYTMSKIIYTTIL